MRSIFYDNLISEHKERLMTEIISDLHHLEQEELYELVEEILHQQILALILDELPIAHHENFLLRFHQDPNDLEFFTFLKFHSPLIEEKISEKALITIEEIKLDLTDQVS